MQEGLGRLTSVGGLAGIGAHREIVRQCVAGNPGAARRIDGDSHAPVVLAPPQVRGVYEGAAAWIELGHEGVACHGVRLAPGPR